MQQRRRVLQWNLQTLLLLTAAVAVWVAYFHTRRQIAPLEARIASLQQMARELIIEDEDRIAAVGLPPMWFDENRWDIHLPEGRYTMRLATRRIDQKGLAIPTEEAILNSGRHRIELVQSEQPDRQTVTILVDDRSRIEVTESGDWDPGHGSEGGSSIGNCVQLPPDEAVVLFRRRFTRQLQGGRHQVPKGPTEGLLLWIEPQTR